MFRNPLFTLAKIWKQPQHLCAQVYILKLCYIYAMNDYSALEKNEIVLFAATWQILEMITLYQVTETETTGSGNALQMQSEKTNSTGDSLNLNLKINTMN